MLFMILQKLNDIYFNEKNIGINWYYEEDDELEEAEAMFGNFKIPVKFIKQKL